VPTADWPTRYRSREGSQRGFCPACSSTLCAEDDGSDGISMTLGPFDEPGAIVPESHSYTDKAPGWLAVGKLVSIP
jgi:hypothetical protein